MSLPINRRNAMMMAGAAAATLLAGETFAAQSKVKPLKVLAWATRATGLHIGHKLA